MHTLFVREHNRLVDKLAAQHPELQGEELYQRARRHVIALLQSITYNEFLPLLLGRGTLPRYRGYKPEAAKGISNLFSTASYRFGHSALSESLLRLNADGETIEHGNLLLRDAFFNPTRITEEGGIEPVLRGLAAQRCQEVDIYVVDSLRNFLFGEPGAGGFDLVSLNIQRGRDHGLPGYNETRTLLGLNAKKSFAEINPNPDVQERLANAYSHPDEIDVWVGGLAEKPNPGSMVGELITIVLSEQFIALRDGDRFWYEQVLPRDVARTISRTTLADVIRRNTNIGSELPDDVFRVAGDAIRSSQPRR